jgi:hypothetical protein
MVGGTIRRKLIHRESFRASVLHHSEIHAVPKSIAELNCLLTTPSLLSSGTPSYFALRFRRQELLIPLRYPPALKFVSALSVVGHPPVEKDSS